MKQEIHASGYKSSTKSMLKSNFEFEVLVNGHSTKEYFHDGRNYIEGKEGSRFSLRMRNNSSSRALFVPTVDGLSILNGKEASFNSRGYIVNAYDALTIDGWRTSDEKVAEFFFSAPNNAYAKRKGKGNNLGVIGCAIFKEKDQVHEIVKIIEKYIPYPQPKYPTWPDNQWPQWYSTTVNPNTVVDTIYTCSNSTGDLSGISVLCTSSSSGSANFNMQATSKGNSAGLGTGFGQEKVSPVTTVSFDKEESPSAVFTLFYNTRENLEAIGVEFKKPVYVAPSPFPNEEGYCEKPY